MRLRASSSSSDPKVILKPSSHPTEYSKLLRHPKWQKMKPMAQICAESNCEKPGCDYPMDENNQLHVHHTYYEDGPKPWEYPIENLQCLCERHHAEAHGRTGKVVKDRKTANPRFRKFGAKMSAIDLGDPATLDKIIAEAIDLNKLESRGIRDGRS